MAHALGNSTKLARRPAQARMLRGVRAGEEEFLALTPYDARRKRQFDLVVAVALLFLILPVILLVTLLIKLTSPGPALCRQPRVGLHNRIFYCYKFRTMYRELDDSRFTPLGRWLRRLRFDELPQLFNVVKGDMSLVGPRPFEPAGKAGEALFVDVARNYALCHGVLPGVTGWARINGYRGPARTRQQLIQRLEFDLHYIKNWSIWFDMAIICRTLVVLLFDEKAG